MTWLVCSDLHLTDRPRDSYRFGLFRWLAKQQQRYNVTHTYILGDITDRKDNHSSTLVNKIIDELTLLKPPIYVLRGNHDGIDPANPFFRFMTCIDGLEFVVDPYFNGSIGVAFLPHQQDQEGLVKACATIRPGSIVMGHNTFDGAIAETGSRLSGLSPAPIASAQPSVVWCGDVHKPQALNYGQMKLHYVGSPYPIRFGDDFATRTLLINDRNMQNLTFPCLNKWNLRVRDADEILRNNKLRRGDQVKITIELSREELTEWATYKQRALAACRELGVEVFGVDLAVNNIKPQRPITPNTFASARGVFDAYCKTENVPRSVYVTGLDLLKEPGSLT